MASSDHLEVRSHSISNIFLRDSERRANSGPKETEELHGRCRGRAASDVGLYRRRRAGRAGDGAAARSLRHRRRDRREEPDHDRSSQVARLLGAHHGDLPAVGHRAARSATAACRTTPTCSSRSRASPGARSAGRGPSPTSARRRPGSASWRRTRSRRSSTASSSIRTCVQVRFSTEFVGFEETEDGVVCEIRSVDTGEIERWHAKYLLACDGAGSQTRRAPASRWSGRRRSP